MNEVLSASVGHTETMNLQEGVKFSLPNMESPRHAKCVYWDEKGKFWATDGLLTLTHSGFTTQCSSSHLSYFSVASVSLISPTSLWYLCHLFYFSMASVSFLLLFCGICVICLTFLWHQCHFFYISVASTRVIFPTFL